MRGGRGRGINERRELAHRLGGVGRLGELEPDRERLPDGPVRSKIPTLVLMAVPVLKELSHLPVIVDPSHAAGRRDLVRPLSLAAAAVGADGIIVEVHPNPDEAICDGPQALIADEFAEYAHAVEQAAALAGKALSAV